MVGKVVIPLGKAGLDTLVGLQGLSRAVMFGSYAVYQDTMRDVEAQDGLPEDFDIDVALSFNEARVGATGAFAGALVFTANAWTLRKLVLKSRADFISDVGKILMVAIDQLIEGKPLDIKGFSKGGLTSLRGQALALQNAVDEGLDITTIGLDIIKLKSQIDVTEELFRQFEDTFEILEWANRIGDRGQGARLDEVASSLLTPKQATRFKTIADSQNIFGRNQQIGSQLLSSGKSFRPFANKDIAMLANMFIATETYDDMFDLAKEMKEMKLEFKKMRTQLFNLATSIDAANEAVKTRITFGQADYLDDVVKGSVSALANNTLKATANAGDEISRLQNIRTAFTAKVVTATKVADGFIARAIGQFGYGVAYALTRTATGVPVVGLKKKTSKALSKKVGSAVKGTLKGVARFLNYFFFVDTIIWAATGLIDLAFIDEDKEYENAMAQYLADNWGFSVSGWLVDTTFDALLSEEAQDVALQNLRATIIATIVNSESLQDIVVSLVEFYQVELDITVFPADFYITRDEAVLAVKESLAVEPEDILAFFLVACVSKVVFKGWVLPAFRATQGAIA